MSDADSARPPRSPARELVLALRTAAFALLVLGFSGWVIDEGGEVSLESPFALAFGLGVGCALASIYLGIFLANRD
ncbi:hypothetical protein HTZ84_15955 [Haloterrigena sp. SYSU A558-1]|uniref:Uncharacterized protein n=1 Tax=Haloterrigena gelatinilytica TaxID=2741724 RepID=A0A8J8GJK5_9EURY|nr:hypothetical protein [Haloterrigena gelatinilytica]NUB90405.1 hypothetical protein [Haloterrigena gelatinilytica]NUC73776.1 hypothetical protein [Haloterrigena gelatinilytica]